MKKQHPLTLVASCLAFSIATIVPSLGIAKLNVVSTVGDLGAAARHVGGKRVEVTVLATPQADPHYVDAKPSYIQKLSNADLLVANGMSLEVGWLPTLVENARNPKIQKGSNGYFDASTAIERKGVPDTEVTRSQGDVHPEGNPHYTLAPGQMARVALALGKRLAKLDSKHASYYEKRAENFAKRALVAKKKWRKKFKSLPESCRKAVIYHEAWTYVLDWLELQKVETIEPKPGVPPNPRHVSTVVSAIKRQSVPLILRLEYYPASTIRQIADKTDAEIATAQGHTREDGDYIDRANQLAKSIHSKLVPACEVDK